MNQAHEFLKGKIWELVVWRALGKPPTEACGWSQHLTPGLGVLELTSMLQSQCSQPKSLLIPAQPLLAQPAPRILAFNEGMCLIWVM